MTEAFILALVAATSLGAYLIGARGLGLRRRALTGAAGRMLECVGLTLLFLGVNLAVGILAILAARAVSRGFVSFYLADDVVLLPLSLLPGARLRLVARGIRTLSAREQERRASSGR